MSRYHHLSSWMGKFIFASGLVFSVLGNAFAGQESTIFAFDGKDFIRAQTTLITEEGKSAVNTKLNQDSAAYKALINNSPYIGDTTVFGQKCDAKYAPLTDKNGRLTGALFVANCVKK